MSDPGIVYTKNDQKYPVTLVNTPEEADVFHLWVVPTGKMPFSIPVPDEAVTNKKVDLPCYLEEKGYSLSNYEQGLSCK